MSEPIKYTADDLDAIAYREIQAIAKAKDIPTNQRKSKLIEAIIASQNSDLVPDLVEEKTGVHGANVSDLPSGAEAKQEKDVNEETNEEGSRHENPEASYIRVGIEASDCLSSPDFNIKKSFHPQHSSLPLSSSSSIDDKWLQMYKSSPIREDQTLSEMHDVTRDFDHHDTNTNASKEKTSHTKPLAVTTQTPQQQQVAVTSTPVKFDESANIIHEFHEYGCADDSPSDQIHILSDSSLHEDESASADMKLNGLPTPMGKKTIFQSPTTKGSEQYNVFWTYDEYKERCNITTPQSLKMMQDNISTPQFLENQRKDMADRERAEVLSHVNKGAKELFGDLLPPSKEKEFILPSSIVTKNSDATLLDSTCEVENKENFGQQAKNLIDGVSGFISKVNSNIKTLVGLPSPKGCKTNFFSPESRPFSINWSSAHKSEAEIPTPIHDSSCRSSNV